MEKLDCEYTDEIVCPHCGYEHTDSYEKQDSGMDRCDDCQKEFYVEIDHSISYTSTCGKEKSDCDFVDMPTEDHPDYQECSRCSSTNFTRFN